MNILSILPILYWHQNADYQDAHHRTETVFGIGDISIGARWLIKNQSFGPGQRLFIGLDVSIPTGESYENNPYSSDADSINHRHFALGDGLVSLTVNSEWWYRSEYSYVFGISGRYSFPWEKSDIGFLPGKQYWLNLHAIRQKPLFAGIFPYLKLLINLEAPDYWEGIKAKNSGGKMVEGMLGLDLEINEKITAVISFNIPIWRELKGSQLDSYTLAASFRILWHRH